MSKLDLITIFDKKMKIGIVLNGLLLSFFFLTTNCVDEELVVGVISTYIFFFIFAGTKEFHYEILRQIRLRTKKIFRFQKIFLKRVLFFYVVLVKRCLKLLKKIYYKYVTIKFLNLFFCIFSKKVSFYSKLLFLKVFFLNIILHLVYKSLQSLVFGVNIFGVKVTKCE